MIPYALSRPILATDTPSEHKSRRNQHIQACLRREIASKREYLKSDVHYCHWCFNWVVGSEEWNGHCQAHIDDLGSKRCGQMTYYHTPVRPGYYPFCLGDSTKSAGQRLQSQCRDAEVWKHVDGHLEGSQWPRRCPHPLCTMSLVDGQDLRFHFIDDHGLSRSVPRGVKHLGALPPHPDKEKLLLGKRKIDKDNVEASWPSHEQFSPTHPPKKARQGPSTIAHSLLSWADEKAKNPLPVIDLTVSDSSTGILAGPPSPGGEESMWLPEELECGSISPTRFQSCDSALVDSTQHDDNDCDFSQFIRSPSPDCMATSNEGDKAAVDKHKWSQSSCRSGRHSPGCYRH